MYKKIIQMIIEAETEEDINKVCTTIDKEFQNKKISWNDNEQLYNLVAKIDGSYRHGVMHYEA